MASSLIGGWLAQGARAAEVCVVETDPARAQALRERFAVLLATDVQLAVRGAQTVVLAVKPQQVAAALSGVTLNPGALLLSVAAGVTTASLQRLCGDAVHIVRCMPNTPALLGCGMTGLYASPAVPTAVRNRAQDIMASAGETCWLTDEAQLDAVTAVSGSGPAYLFLLTELMQQSAQALGLSEAVGRQLAVQTVIGAARMLAETGSDPAVLRAQVTSPGGTTQAALNSLRDDHLASIFERALRAAAARSAALGAELDAALQPPASPPN